MTLADRSMTLDRPAPRPSVPRPIRAHMRAVAMAVPDRRVGNDEIAAQLDVDDSWIAKRTGTRERPWARPGERMTEFAARAGRSALEQAGIGPEDLDVVIVATSTPESFVPNAAPVVAGMLGAGQAAALDVGSACTGFLSGLSMACGQVESGRAEHALLIGSEILSQFLDPTDRNTAPLFADGAGAAVISAAGDGDGGIGPIILHSDAEGAEWIQLHRTGFVHVSGHEVFKAAVRCMSEVTLETLTRAGLEIGDIDLFVYHQANSRIIRAVGERLDLPSDRVVDYVDRYANASTATLPIALTCAAREGRLQPGHRVLMSAFGGGFTWGGTVLEWSGAA